MNIRALESRLYKNTLCTDNYIVSLLIDRNIIAVSESNIKIFFRILIARNYRWNNEEAVTIDHIEEWDLLGSSRIGIVLGNSNRLYFCRSLNCKDANCDICSGESKIILLEDILQKDTKCQKNR